MHNIRLKRPWHRERHVAGQDPDRQLVDVPDETPLASDSGSTIYRRKFNRPTGLDENDAVFLRIESWKGAEVQVGVNGTEFSPRGAEVDLELTSCLKPHNEIVIEISDHDEFHGRITGEVSLQIRPSLNQPCER